MDSGVSDHSRRSEDGRDSFVPKQDSFIDIFEHLNSDLKVFSAL